VLHKIIIVTSSKCIYNDMFVQAPVKCNSKKAEREKKVVN